MLDVYREILPDGFLLILSSDIADLNGEVNLSRALHRASRSEKRAVLIDCSLVESLSDEAVELLLAYSFILRAQSRRLVLCHVPSAVRYHFLDLDPASQPLLVSSLLEAVDEIKISY
ncbi:STAS domain-containing protein [Hymenobacter sp. BT186]|uniref:STAS domain-containing protein n=1 Tax=Hymenobacter telluris TaxID=2816474 RepID=A0A939J7H5_9BACT|nr:STAS domain-containing protein [Hymenobacter telluris]MBO0356739.1 STAS domain-containing protein [Hymenobacter telluris]MBW3372764.1 STAS domain-containing protein [Hymenobacter norwichensis]